MTQLQRRAGLHLYALALFLFFNLFQAKGQISEIITDFNGVWRSGRPTINSIKPDNSHNLLAFKYRNIIYSTGVNDNTLSQNSIPFITGDYRALPIDNLPTPPTSGTYAGLGQLYDGVNNGPSNPPPANNPPFYLTDGLKGLNLGTAIYNLPISSLQFAVSNFQLNKFGDSIPDILITQMGETTNSSLDVLYFSNAAGDTIGNSITARFIGLDTLGLGAFDFYSASQNPMTIPSDNFTNSVRAIRFFAADLTQFGLNSSNIGNIRFFNHKLSGTSDIAFIAYNAEAIRIQADVKPGCFTTLPSIWVKAGEATNTITNNEKINKWQDRSANTFSMVQATSVMQPSFKVGSNTGFNFNPYIDFDAANRLLSVNSPFSAETSNADFFIVGRPTNTTSKNKIIGFSKTANDGASQGDYPALSYTAAGESILENTNNAGTLTGTTTNLGSTYLWQTNYTNGSSIRFYKNGTANGTSSMAGNMGNYSFQMGDAAPGDNGSDFDVAEVIMFPQNLSSLERNQVETYLAVKYGLPLGHDYVSGTSGNAVWSLSANTGYSNNIFGMGREDCQALNQKQSKSQTTNALLTIGNNSIATDNGTNFSTLTNLAYSLMGDNGDALTWQTTEKPVKIEQRIGREWKVRETGTVGSLLVQAPASNSTLSVKLPDPASCKMFMLVDNDGDFSTGIIAQIEMTLNGTNWEASYNFTDGNYITFATENKDYGDLPNTWPTASAGVSGCDVNKDGLYNRLDNNGSKVLVWAGTSVTSEVTANTANSDAADDGLQTTNSILVVNASNQFNVLLNSNTPGTTVYYRLWFDWNNDGNFSNDNGLDVTTLAPIPATYAGSAVVTGSGPTTVTVAVRTPLSFSLQYKTRLIVSSTAIDDLYRSNSSTYQFAIGNGEVEDYNAIIILPVVLKSFTASAQGCNALLQWQTTSEQNSNVFKVEQSTDGQNFSTVAVVAAKNTTAGADYQYFTNQLAAGSYYFRLKMIDKDGQWAYSTIINTKIVCNATRLIISPNPVKDNLYISGLPKQAQLVITDATGRILLSQKVGNTSGTGINLTGWAPGMYNLQVLANGLPVETHKFLKMQ